jgi:hypothetical protein
MDEAEYVARLGHKLKLFIPLEMPLEIEIVKPWAEAETKLITDTIIQTRTRGQRREAN